MSLTGKETVTAESQENCLTSASRKHREHLRLYLHYLLFYIINRKTTPVLKINHSIDREPDKKLTGCSDSLRSSGEMKMNNLSD